jgi:hypothetical protein
MMNGEPLFLTLSHLLEILYPTATRRARKQNTSNYRKILTRYGLKMINIPNTRYRLCDPLSLRWEYHRIDPRDFIRNRSKYMNYEDWLKREKLQVSKHTKYKFLRKKMIPYIRVRGAKNLVFVPADLRLLQQVIEKTKGDIDNFYRSLAKLGQGSIHAIVFPNWKKYSAPFRHLILYLLAQQGRLLKVGRRYGVLVSALDYTLFDLLQRENNNLANFIYFIPSRWDQKWFDRALRRGEVSIVHPHEVCFPTRALFSLLAAELP